MAEHHIVAYFNLRRRSIDVVELSEDEWKSQRPQHSHLDDIVAGDGSTPSSGGGGETPHRQGARLSDIAASSARRGIMM